MDALTLQVRRFAKPIEGTRKMKEILLFSWSLLPIGVAHEFSLIHDFVRSYCSVEFDPGHLSIRYEEVITIFFRFYETPISSNLPWTHIF